MTVSWLLITSHMNWDNFAETGVWAFDKATRLDRVSIGDLAVVYLTAEGGYSAIGGLVSFQSKIETGLARGGAFTMHPFHARVKVENRLRSPVPFEKVRDKIKFLPDTPYWGLWLRGKPLRDIPREDALLLEKVVHDQVEREQPQHKRNSGR